MLTVVSLAVLAELMSLVDRVAVCKLALLVNSGGKVVRAFLRGVELV